MYYQIYQLKFIYYYKYKFFLIYGLNFEFINKIIFILNSLRYS